MTRVSDNRGMPAALRGSELLLLCVRGEIIIPERRFDTHGCTVELPAGRGLQCQGAGGLPDHAAVCGRTTALHSLHQGCEHAAISQRPRRQRLPRTMP